MKKLFSILLVALLAITFVNPTRAFAADSAKVYVTISNGNGALVVVQGEVKVTDADGDGALTINDALYLAHEEFYTGGAEAGYASAPSDWGLSLTKLWGEENGGSYGYYVNNTAAMGLTDAVKDGDYINAFVYTDLVAWSDSYSFFDVNTANVGEDDELTLTLKAAGYDASWNPVMNPVEGAVILVDGVATDFVTDAEGNVTVSGLEAGEHVISARSDSLTLVPPVVMVEVEAADDDVAEAPLLIAPKPENLAETGASVAVFYVVGSAAALMAAYAGKRKNEIEK